MDYYPQNIKLADPEFFKPKKIDVLLGAEIFYELLKFGQIRIPNSDLKFQNSKFGFIASGVIYNSECQNSQKIHCGFVCDYSNINEQIQKFWQLEDIGIKDDPSLDDGNKVLETFEKTVVYKNKRYEVELPWKKDWKELGNNYTIAKKRLNALRHRMQRDPDLKLQYCEVLNEYEKKNIVEKVSKADVPENKPIYYLPHQPVFKNSLTTKMRIVFDASSHDSKELSLNDCLWPGPNLNGNLLDLLIFFRLNKIALVADIEKAFLQITLAKNDRDAVRFLWNENGVDQIYRFKRVLFGVTSSPFLLSATIQTHLRRFRDKYPTTTECLERCFYVDDLVAGADNIQEALEISEQSVAIMNQASMVLRKWSTNDDTLMQLWKHEGIDIQPQQCPDDSVSYSTKVLGLSWDFFTDQLIIDVQNLVESLSRKENSKRFLLSAIGKIFDPLGLLTPFTIRVKCLLQILWMRNISWDAELPPDILKVWLQWCSEVPHLLELKIPRNVLNSTKDESTDIIELHCFCDASQKAYGTAIYLRIVKNNNIEVNLIASKSRVSPLKKITLPRLELLGALLAARLANKIKKILDRKKPSTVFFWTDSKITLYWIKGSSNRWKSFVANRVTEIQKLSNSSAWAHCPGNLNPADLLSRGISIDALLDSDIWWKGPPFLNEINYSFNSDTILISESDISNELKKTFDCDSNDLPIALTVFNCDSFLDQILERSNNYMTIIHIMCYIFRFVHYVKHKFNKISGHLVSKELEHAEIFLAQLAQQSEFSAEIKNLKQGATISCNSKLKSLNCFLDENDCLRVGGRLHNSDLNINAKHPIILPGKHPLTFIIVKYFHLKYLHVGPNALLYHIRRKFWLINGRNVCRKIVFECIICFKNKPKLESQIMGDLPRERVTSSFLFFNVGTDYCGPFYIKFKNQRKGILNKVYLCIFICLSTKAMHIEFVTDQTSDAFIACLKRFFSRRGKCSKLFSDNGRNFIGANIELKKLHKLVKYPDKNLANYLSSENIEWKFIPPKSPNFGGLWEAGVKSVKFHLKRIIGNAHLTLEEFLTIILEVESVLNSRPLTPMTSEFDDFETLSPGHFLIGRPLTSIVEPLIENVPENKLSKWKKITKFSQQIWKLWKRDYLNNLQQRNKWRFSKNNVNVGELVLIKEELMPGTKWLTGRISEVFLGKDEKIRVVNVLLPTGKILKRNVRDICILPINND